MAQDFGVRRPDAALLGFHLQIDYRRAGKTKKAASGRRTPKSCVAPYVKRLLCGTRLPMNESRTRRLIVFLLVALLVSSQHSLVSSQQQTANSEQQTAQEPLKKDRGVGIEAASPSPTPATQPALRQQAIGQSKPEIVL